MPSNSRRLPLGLCATSLALWACTQAGTGAADTSLTFEITLPAGEVDTPVDGRLLVLLSVDDSAEPRFQISDGPGTQIGFGVDVEGWEPGTSRVIDGSAWGYPITRLADVPSGDYHVQAFLNRYQTFNRSDGHTVKLPPERGDGQQWNRKPGNLHSLPVSMRIDPSNATPVAFDLDQVIPDIPPPPEHEYIRHVRIRSDLLSEFWGTDTYLGAHVLLPQGFDDHPDARYPLAVFHGHFPYDFGGWREEPPEEDLECTYSARFDLECYNRTQQELAYQLYQDWTGPDFPRMLVIQIQHANPYYDDSYAVNSENLGPYGDAITHELIPHIEEQFRGLGEGWSRFLYGGSTGGWEALGAQIKYPDDYNGAYGACPDPIDFRAYTVVDIYNDTNAYYLDSNFKRTPRPGNRDYLGHVSSTLEEMNHRELLLGTRGRSGQQWDIWEAVYSPVDDDGYPKRLWDKVTGDIDPEVAAHWRENYDLVHIMRRDWATLGPRLEGKINVYVGDMDNYYLNNAVYLAEEFLEGTQDPYFGGEIDYGDRAEHCWNGDQTRGNGYSRLRYIQMFAPKIVQRILDTAPSDADLTSWRY